MVQQAAAEPARLLTLGRGETEAAILRRDSAARIAAAAVTIEPRIVDAFASVPREGFLGAPPWTLVQPGVYERVVDGADVAPLYDDVLIQLDGARGVNNGSPSLHALMLQALGVKLGDSVVHFGVGGGYYTAILAELAGPAGRVTAVEFDAALATAAAGHLRAWENVTVVRGDAGNYPESDVDRVYVNFGVVAPPRKWVTTLRDGGTLVFPLAAPALGRGRHSGGGIVLRIGRDGDRFDAREVSPCGFVMAQGPLAGTPLQRNWLGPILHARSLRLRRVKASDVWNDGSDWPNVFAS